jgi:hypothetical protein
MGFNDIAELAGEWPTQRELNPDQSSNLRRSKRGMGVLSDIKAKFFGFECPPRTPASHVDKVVDHVLGFTEYAKFCVLINVWARCNSRPTNH